MEKTEYFTELLRREIICHSKYLMWFSLLDPYELIKVSMYFLQYTVQVILCFRSFRLVAGKTKRKRRTLPIQLCRNYIIDYSTLDHPCDLSRLESPSNKFLCKNVSQQLNTCQNLSGFHIICVNLDFKSIPERIDNIGCPYEQKLSLFHYFTYTTTQVVYFYFWQSFY